MNIINLKTSRKYTYGFVLFVGGTPNLTPTTRREATVILVLDVAMFQGGKKSGWLHGASISQREIIRDTH